MAHAAGGGGGGAGSRFPGSGWSFPRRPLGQARLGALEPLDPPSLSAARPMASGLRSWRARRPAEAPGATPPRTRHGQASKRFQCFSHFPTAPNRPRVPKWPRARRGGAFCALTVCWDFFFRSELPPPLSSHKSCGFPRSQQEVEKVEELSLALPCPETLKTRGVRPRGDIWGQGEGAKGAFFRPPPSHLVPQLPSSAPAPGSAQRPGSCSRPRELQG